MGIEWQYEPDVFSLPSGAKYIPDFYLKGIGLVEVKPEISHLDENPKYREFAQHVASLSNVPVDRTRYLGFASSVVHDQDNVSGRRTIIWLTERSEIAGWRFMVCPTCRKVTLTFETEVPNQLLGFCDDLFTEDYSLRTPIDEVFEFVRNRRVTDGRPLSAAIIEAFSGMTDDEGKRVIDVFQMVQQHNNGSGEEPWNHSVGLMPYDVDIQRRLLQNQLNPTPIDLSQGAKVFHKEYGDGRVIRRDVIGKEVLIQFFDEERSIPLDEAKRVMVNDW